MYMWVTLALRSNDSEIYVNSKILCLEIWFCRSQVTVTIPSKDCFVAISIRKRRRLTVPQLAPLSYHLRYCGAKGPSQCRFPCKATNFVCSSQRMTEKGLLMMGKRTFFLDQTEMGFWTLHRQLKIHTVSDSKRLLIWREHRTKYHQSNTVEVQMWWNHGLGSVLTRWPY